MAATDKLLDEGRRHEKAGRIDAALQAYRRGAFAEEAARLLIGEGRFAEAAQVLLDKIGRDAADPGALPPDRKRLALKAAICLANSGDARQAADLFLRLGERGRAAEALRKAGAVAEADAIERGAAGTTVITTMAPVRTPPATAGTAGAQRLEREGKLEAAVDVHVASGSPGAAAAVAQRLGQTARAAALYVEANMPFEAGECFRQLGDGKTALAHYLRVPRDSPNHRAACVHAAVLTAGLQTIAFETEQFLSQFLSSPPQNDAEIDAFYKLARLYESVHALPPARELYEAIDKVRPAHSDVRERLLELTREERVGVAAFERILKEEEAFRSRVGVPSHASDDDLPDLPDLPKLPSLPDAPASLPQPRTRAGTLAPGRGRPATRASAARGVARDADGDRDEPTLAEGAVVSGRYRLEKKIGQGGMAAVYRALDLDLEERIAIKFLSQSVADDATLQRFKTEVLLSRQLNHPNIIRLHDIGGYRDWRYITMELLDGMDLAQHIGGHKQPFVEGIGYLMQACIGLQLVHDRSIVHRDVKPDNFFLTSAGVLKVMDFGIAKRQATKGVTVFGMTAGTPQYMSPEQASNFSSVTHLTDIYALGVIAYQMFTGTLPFDAPDVMPLLMMHIKEPPQRPRARAPEIPADIEELILNLLAKNPDDRVQTCRELGARLGEIRHRLLAAGAPPAAP